MTQNKYVLNWINEMAEMTCPDKIVWIDGTEAQAEEIRNIKTTVAAEKAANLPEAMIQNIAKGRMAKFFKESCLLNQEFIQDSKMTVTDYLQATDKELTVVTFNRFTLRAE